LKFLAEDMQPKGSVSPTTPNPIKEHISLLEILFFELFIRNLNLKVSFCCFSSN
jgi:hypothetical protein